MKQTACLTLLLASLFMIQAEAVTVYECVDEEGNTTFQDRCPPGTTPANEMNIRSGGAGAAEDTTTAAAPAEAPAPAGGGGEILFYTTSTNCDACVLFKDTLNKYGAGFTEKDISTDLAVREELKQKSGATGSVLVPTVIIGTQVISGFDKAALAQALEAAGYSKPAPPAVPVAGQQPAGASGGAPAPATQE